MPEIVTRTAVARETRPAPSLAQVRRILEQYRLSPRRGQTPRAAKRAGRHARRSN